MGAEMTMPIMPPEAAVWVREHVWPAWMRAMDDDYARGCFLFRMCACELGVCVPCSRDEHGYCLTRQHDGQAIGWDMAVWAWTEGRLPVHGRSLVGVMVAGRSCRWTCPCRHVGEYLPAAAAAPPVPDRPRLEPATAHPTTPEPAQGALF